MDNSVEALIEKLKGIGDFVAGVSENYFDDNNDDILDMNKLQMLVLGIDARGDKLGEYAPSTVKKRKKKGLQTDYKDLRFEGDFQDGIVMENTGDLEYEMDSNDTKWDDRLRSEWPDAIGLTDDNEDRLTDIFTNYLDFQVDNYLSTNFSPGVQATV